MKAAFGRRSATAMAALFCVGISGCATNVIALAARWVTPEEFAVADETFERADAGDWAAIRTSFHPSVEDPGSDEAWSAIADVLDGADIVDRQLIGINVSTVSDQRNVRLVYEGTAMDGWYLVNVRIRDGELYGFHVSQNAQSLVAANAFGLSTVGLSHVLLFLLGAGSIALAMLASYRVLKSSIRRRRLWAVLPWLMVGKISLNWTTGAVGMQLISVQMPPIAFTKGGPAAPWIFGFGLPVLGVIALRKVRRAGSTVADDPEIGEDVVAEAGGGAVP